METRTRTADLPSTPGAYHWTAPRCLWFHLERGRCARFSRSSSFPGRVRSRAGARDRTRPGNEEDRLKRAQRPRSRWDHKQRGAVQWYAPGVLGKSAVRVLVSMAFGSFLDKREL